MKSVHYLIPGLLALFLCACGDDPAAQTFTMDATPGRFEIVVKAEGSLQAVNSTPLNAPRSRGGANVIAWISQEGVFVKEGEVLVRFDKASLEAKEQESNTELSNMLYRSAIDQRNHDHDTTGLDGTIFVLDKERDKAKRFAVTNPELYERNEIIESEVDIKLLDTKVDHFSTKKDRHLKTGSTQQEINELKMKSTQIQLDQVRERMKNLAITAPHDGYFFYHRNWRGEPPKVGEIAWGRVGELPDLSEMEAKVYILEKEANGIKTGLKAEVILDANPGFPYAATVKKVATLAKPLDRESPINYFEVILTLEKTEPEFMRPSGQLKARIFIDQQDDVIALPNQVLFSEDGETWVYVKDGNAFRKQPVEIGTRGPTRTVVKGLTGKEKVAMNDPGEEAVQ